MTVPDTFGPDTFGRAAHDSARALPDSVAGPLYARLSAELGPGVVLDVGGGPSLVTARLSGRALLVDVVDWRSFR